MPGALALAVPRSATVRRLSRGRSSVGLLLAIWLLFGVVGGHCGIPSAQLHEPNPGHAQRLSAAQGVGLARDAGPAHRADSSTSPCPAKIVTAVLPSPVPALAAFVAVATAAVPVLFADLATPGGRSPPTGRAFVTAGRGLLVRFCVARS